MIWNCDDWQTAGDVVATCLPHHSAALVTEQTDIFVRVIQGARAEEEAQVHPAPIDMCRPTSDLLHFCRV